MYSSDVFAVITAHDNKDMADHALKLKHNSKWYCKATGVEPSELIMSSREITPAEDSQPNDDHKKRLMVSFSKLLAVSNFEDGLQLSTNSILCHILLGHRGIKGISGRQISSIIVILDILSIQA